MLAGKVKPGWGDLSIGMKDPLKEIIRRIVEEVDPDKIVLFGSRTKGKSEIWSDYDICVLKSDIVKRNDLEKRIYLKLFGVGVPVDIIVETNERFEKLNEAEK
ncbi:MAG: nucleotidyltransferase domain-containing protein [bacterium]